MANVRRLLAVTAALLLLGCSDSTEPVTYENIAGIYDGPIAGTSQGYTLDATLTVVIKQNQGSLSGRYRRAGMLDDGVASEYFESFGTFTGTMQAGQNPSVNITIRVPLLCLSYSAAFSGAFDSANGILTMSGPLEFLDNGCNVTLSFSSVIILSR